MLKCSLRFGSKQGGFVEWHLHTRSDTPSESLIAGQVLCPLPLAASLRFEIYDCGKERVKTLQEIKEVACLWDVFASEAKDKIKLMGIAMDV